jgi:cytochrome c/Tfp pilus assembly protein PilF
MRRRRPRGGDAPKKGSRSQRASREQTTDSRKQARTGKRLLRPVLWFTGAVLLIVSLVFGRGVLGACSRYMAVRQMDAWALGQAFVWLDRADWIDPQNPATELMRAKSFRQLHDISRREAALARARKFGVSPQSLQNEITLGNIQTGQLAEGAESELTGLMEAGLSPHDIAAAFISGCVAQNNMERAEALQRGWQLDFPDHPHPVYMRGVLRAMIGDVKGSQEAFEQVLEIEPRHELAQIALAQQHEAAKRPAKAVDLYLELAESLPENETILLGLARSLRKLGRTRQARAVLAPMAAKPNPISQVAVEMGHIEVETGHYDRAKGWFDKGAARDMINLDTLAAAGIALAATGAMDAADRVFSWISDDLTLAASLDDLQERLAVEPENRAAAAEHQNVLRKLSTKSAEDNPYQWALAGISAGERHNSPGMQLYAQHCSVCHGANGNGNGRAARYLFPRPRNLRADSFRLVSTRNGIPTIEDIRALIRQGIHGTSMTSASTLSDNEVDQLIDVVEQMRRDGIREQYIEMLEKDEEPIDEQELENVVRSRTTPGELVLTPAFDASTAEAVAQGGEIYIQQTCVACHGKIGAGDETLPLFDDHGFPSLPRDLRHDLFKGGSKSAAIYTRLVAGMPGTPHPASANLSDQELVALVAYCQSLVQEPKRNLTNHQRAVRASRRRPVDFFAQ